VAESDELLLEYPNQIGRGYKFHRHLPLFNFGSAKMASYCILANLSMAGYQVSADGGAE
jgi:hypothetical protein